MSGRIPDSFRSHTIRSRKKIYHKCKDSFTIWLSLMINWGTDASFFFIDHLRGVSCNATCVRFLMCCKWNNTFSRFSHDVTKIQTTRALILLIFYFNDYFNDVQEQLKTNSHTKFCSKWVLGFVIDCTCVTRHLLQLRILRDYLRICNGGDGSAKLYTHFRKSILVDLPVQRNETIFQTIWKNFTK